MTIQKISAIAGATLLAAGLLAGAAAQAQPGPRPNDNRPPVARPDNRPPPPPVVRPHHRPPPAYRPGPAGRPLPPMAVGRPLPYDYRGYNYRVDNWDYYRLPRPRRGQYWVQYGPQFLLVSPAGLVLQVFMP